MMKFSIIVPVYGTEKTLRRCLDSIVNQTYENFELIIVNDCSQDNSSMILEEYESKYGCIIVINHSINKGSLHARLTGLKEVTGDYVLFVDSDDELMLDACEVISEFISQNGVFDIIHFNTKVCSKDPATVDFYQNFTKPLGIKLIGEQIPYNFFLEGNIESFLWNKCYSYSIFEKLFAMHMPLQITMAEDYFLTSYIMLNSKSYASINNQLYKY